MGGAEGLLRVGGCPRPGNLLTSGPIRHKRDEGGNREVFSSGFQPEKRTFSHIHAWIDIIKYQLSRGVLFQDIGHLANVLFCIQARHTLSVLVLQLGLDQKSMINVKAGIGVCVYIFPL